MYEGSGAEARSPRLETERLVLRAWCDADLDPFAELNADPKVMEHFPGPLTRDESDRVAQRIRDHFARHGFGLFALEAPERAAFIGFVGLSIPGFQAHFTPCVEIGWRLARAHQGQGYATEAARAALDHAFGPLELDEIVSFTIPANRLSERVMRKLGMQRDPSEDFDHPAFPPGHRLRRHVLYRLRRPRTR